MRIPILLLLLSCLIACSKNKFETCTEKPLSQTASFPIGTAFNFNDYRFNPSLASKVDKHFNSITPENALKYGVVNPVVGPYDFSEIDSIKRIANRLGARIHGHTLVWHEQLPGWFASYGGDYEALLQLHIHSVMETHKDILSWDVVNEALTEQGELRTSPWLEKLGEGYVYTAFREAQMANPQATLFYNDFNLALNPRKLDAAIRLCQQLRAMGAKVDGIGMQMHISVSYPNRRQLTEAVEKIWRAGFKVHFSELDIKLNPQGNKQAFTEEDQRALAYKYREVVEIYQQIPSQYQFGITLWGIGDADAWSPHGHMDAPLLFDKDYQPKKAFCAFVSSL